MHPAPQTGKKATNRQIKVLRLYGLPFPEKLSAADASRTIADLWSNEDVRTVWDKYVFLTGDLDNDSDQLKAFNLGDLAAVVLPLEWDHRPSVRLQREALVASVLSSAAPFSDPAPPVVIPGKKFLFTGQFEYGSRANCERAVIDRGGNLSDDPDYLVVGTMGNPDWKHVGYGRKIENAVLSRLAYRTPAIISEAHWRSFL